MEVSGLLPAPVWRLRGGRQVVDANAHRNCCRAGDTGGGRSVAAGYTLQLRVYLLLDLGVAASVARCLLRGDRQWSPVVIR